MKCPFELPVEMRKVETLSKNQQYCVCEANGRVLSNCLNKKQAKFLVQAINSHEKLKRELKASDNWLHRLLKSCVIFLDDGEVTKRAVKKQSRYNQKALKEEGETK